MNELRRMAYLDALGIDAYVSRTQLPGAAFTRRLAIVAARPQAAPPVSNDAPAPVGVPAPAVPPDTRAYPGATRLPQIDTPPHTPVPAKAPVQQQASVSRFSLAAIVAGGWLWLEDLAGLPLATEQVRLVQAMAQALGVRGAGADNAASGLDRPEVAQFDWPIHTNQQLDIGAEAARASVAAFVGRKLEQRHCRGLVLLGQACTARVPLEQVGVLTVTTTSSADILANPEVKRQVWRDLLPLLGSP